MPVSVDIVILILVTGLVLRKVIMKVTLGKLGKINPWKISGSMAARSLPRL
jgi:hypothetical protein